MGDGASATLRDVPLPPGDSDSDDGRSDDADPPPPAKCGAACHWYQPGQGGEAVGPVTLIRRLLGDPQERAHLERLEDFKSRSAAATAAAAGQQLENDGTPDVRGAPPHPTTATALPASLDGGGAPGGDAAVLGSARTAALFAAYRDSALGRATLALHAAVVAGARSPTSTGESAAAAGRQQGATSADMPQPLALGADDADFVVLTCTLLNGRVPGTASTFTFEEVLCCPVGTRIFYLGTDRHAESADFAGCVGTVRASAGERASAASGGGDALEPGHPQVSGSMPVESRAAGAGAPATPATARVHFDNVVQYCALPLTTTNHVLAKESRTRHAPGARLAVTVDGRVWADAVVATANVSADFPARHTLQLGAGGAAATTLACVDLNHCNHYEPLLAQADCCRHCGEHVAAAQVRTSQVHDGITGNVLRIADQLVEVRSTSVEATGREGELAPTTAKGVARELVRQDPRWNARQHGKHTGRLFAVVAPAGTGKTWFSRQIEHTMVLEAKAGRSDYLPLLLPLQRVAFLLRPSGGQRAALDGTFGGQWCPCCRPCRVSPSL